MEREPTTRIKEFLHRNVFFLRGKKNDDADVGEERKNKTDRMEVWQSRSEGYIQKNSNLQTNKRQREGQKRKQDQICIT